MSDARRFDQLERVVRDTRAKVDDTTATVLSRLSSHTHAGGGGGVASVTAANGTITIGGTGTNPTVAVGTIAESQVTNLVSDLAGKAASSHTHAESDVTSLVSDLAGKQPLDSDLTTIAGLTATTDNVIQSVSGAWASRTPAQLKATLAITESDVASLVTDLAGKVPTSRTLTASTGLTGGGDLSADRSFAVSYGNSSGTAAQGNDARFKTGPPGFYSIAEYGLVACSIHPDSVSTNATTVTVSTIEIYRVLVPANTVITGACCYVGTAGTTPGSSNGSGFGLYSDDGATQHRLTANDYTLFTSTGWRSKAFTSTFTVGASDTWYRVAMLHSCSGTAPKFASGPSVGSAFYNAIVPSGTHRRGIFNTSVTSFPASFTASTYGSLDSPMLFLGLY